MAISEFERHTPVPIDPNPPTMLRSWQRVEPEAWDIDIVDCGRGIQSRQLYSESVRLVRLNTGL